MLLSENALLVIDMQQGLFRGPTSPHSSDTVLLNIRLLIENARQAQVPVFLPATSDPMIPHSQSKVR
jgi:nicotinamidase-related amidase